MRGILVTLFSVTALVNAASVNPRYHKDPREAAAICGSAGSEGVLVAHEKCDRFYKCSHGKPVALDCPSNLLYHPELEYCDWPTAVDCGNRIIPGQGDQHSTESVESDEDKEVFDDSGHEDPKQAFVICARPGSDGALISHEHCTKFYKCFQSHPVELICPASLHYNYKLKQCDWPQNVDCGNRVIPNEEDNAGSEPEQNDMEDVGKHDDVHTEEVYSDPSQAIIICAQEDSESVLIAHELCNYFYICLHGRPFPINCPLGLHFDPKSRKCDWPENVECRERIIPGDNNNIIGAVEGKKEIHNDPRKAAEICAEYESVLVAHENCNRFYQCAGGRPVERKCPRGLVYNYIIEQCDWVSNVECGNRIIVEEEETLEEPEDVPEQDVAGHDDPNKAPIICAEEGSDSVLVAHEQCNKFYICAAGLPVARSCTKGLLYNPKKEKCDWADDVTCGVRIIPDDDNEDCVPYKNDKDDDDDYQGNDDPSKAPEICAEEDSVGVLIAHEYCNKFYVCENGHPLTMNCPKNLQFNPKKNQCDWAWDVNCSGRVNVKDDDNVQARSLFQRESAGYDYPSNARNVCGNDESEGVLVSHKYCNKFYQCANHQPVQRICPRGLHFSANDQHCEWPENVDCGDRIIPEEKEDDTEKYDSEEAEPLGNNFDNPSKAPEICAEKDSEGIHIAHEHCNKFYICLNKRPFPVKCPESLYYNPKNERCDWQNNVQCNGRIKE